MTAAPIAVTAPSPGLHLVCYHCGAAVDQPGRWRAILKGEEVELCCAGCQAVARAIAESGLTDYYRARHGVPLGLTESDSAGQVSDFSAFDDPHVQAGFVRKKDGLCEAHLLTEGLRCGACSWLLEQVLAREPGVLEASVNLATERATLRWDPARIRLSALLGVAARFGFALKPFDANQREAQLRQSSRAQLRRLFVAGIAMMQVMMFAVPVYMAQPGEIEPVYEGLMRWASLALTLPVVAYSALPILRNAARELWQRRPGMDTPIALSILAAFAASVQATFAGAGEVWFDTVSMFVFLLLAARFLEFKARGRALRLLDTLAGATPDTVLRLRAGQAPERVAASQLSPGECFLAGVGQAVAVDAQLEDEACEFDCSLITGESRPVRFARGARVPGGAICIGSPRVLRALTIQADSTLSVISRLAQRAATARPAVLLLTDRIARWFVSGLLLLTALVFIAWLAIDSEQAFRVAIALLVVSCPCALSLATPAALAAANATALSKGMIATRSGAFEALADITDVVLDKTGTLTVGRPSLVGVDTFAEFKREQCLAIAAALEVGHPHPVGRALTGSALERGLASPIASQLESHTGAGVSGMIDGQVWRLGGKRFAIGEADACLPECREPRPTGTSVWLSRGGQPIANFLFDDALRENAHSVIDRLRRSGLRLHLVSGDQPDRVQDVAATLGITSLAAQARPDDKLAFVRALQAQGRRVLAVGDGINDAPLLAAADASVAVGEASSLARNAAGVVLLGDGLDTLLALLALAKRTRAIIRQNLAWALGYNLVAIPAAAFGLVSPWVTALGMSLSSLLVALNALRLLPGHPADGKPEGFRHSAAGSVTPLTPEVR